MNTTPDWMHGGESEPTASDSQGVSILGVVAWIAAMAVIAERFLG
jgi:hypothetical protein